MKKAAFYVRVSTGRQEKEATKESQIDELERRIAEDGNILLPQNKFVDDGWTGEMLARPACDMMRDAAKRGEFDILYVYDKGRLSREFIHQELLLMELGDLGLEFYSLHDINAKDENEKMLSYVQGMFHEFEKVKIAERMRRGKLFKTRSGELLGYNAPYGYSYIPIVGTQNGRFEINEIEAEVVWKIFNWIGKEGYSIRKVIKTLYETGIPPQKGKKEYWVKSVIDRLVRNRTYIGEHHYNKTEAVVPKKTLTDSKYKKVKRCSRKLKPKGEWIKCEVPSIIDKELFDLVQDQLEKNSKFANRNKKHDYLVNGLIKCNCGHSRVGQPSGTQFYYRCSERIYRYPLKPVCTEGGINAEVLDGVIWEKVSKILTDTATLRKQAERWLKNRHQVVNNDAEISQIKGELSALDTEEGRYFKAFGQGLADINVYEHSMKDLKKRRDVALAKLATKESESNQTQNIPNLTLEELVKKVKETICELNFADKLNIVRKLVNQVVGNQESVLVTGYIPITIKEKNVSFKTIHRHRRPTQCWQVYII